VRLAALIGALALSGCYSFSTLGRARIVDPHQMEIFGAPTALIQAVSNGAAVRPAGDLGVRYGLDERWELDGRLTTLGATVGPRIQLLRSPDPSSGFDVLIAPALAYTYPDKFALEVPLLLGWNVGKGDQIILGPRLVYQTRFSNDGVAYPLSYVFAGGSVGFAWKVSRHFTLLPEVSFLTQIYSQPGFSSDLEGTLGIQASAGVLFDL
jgi:hypothetical protein